MADVTMTKDKSSMADQESRHIQSQMADVTMAEDKTSMADQEASSSTTTAAAGESTIADRTAAINNGEVEPAEMSKNAQKKAAKQEKLAADKAHKSAKSTVKEAGRADAKKAVAKTPKEKIAGAALIGIDVSKEVDFPSWYQQVLTKGNMLDYYNISGCYIIMSGSYFIWEEVQNWFNKKIKSIGVRNCSFPMFVTEDVLEREKAHIEGFAAEVAWVTHAGNTPLEKKLALRPTSETIMYPYYAKWIRSHRDLPLRLNQWNSVVRWEFKHPQPFLRTREFLWQEGHTAHLTKAEADAEVRQILEWYAGVYEELLAVPVIRGQKTDKEKFAGGLYTTTVEGYIPATGRGIQGGTSHCLGQNFSRMFDITVEDPNASKATGADKAAPLYVWQNSWGLSTRVIGVMVMIHGDDRGLVLPPRVAETQVAIVPVGVTAKTTDEERASLHAQADAIAAVLEDVGIRVACDKRDGYSPGWKFNDWELRGVPLRIELGPGEVAGHFVTTSRRDVAGKEGKGTIPITELNTAVPALLEQIQADLYARADEKFRSHTRRVERWEDFVPAVNAKDVVLVPHCLTEACEDEIKKLSAKSDVEEEVQDEKAPSMGAKSLCIPFAQPEGGVPEGMGCVRPGCEEKVEKWCLFGRSY